MEVGEEGGGFVISGPNNTQGTLQADINGFHLEKLDFYSVVHLRDVLDVIQILVYNYFIPTLI